MRKVQAGPREPRVGVFVGLERATILLKDGVAGRMELESVVGEVALFQIFSGDWRRTGDCSGGQCSGGGCSRPGGR